jgi:hydrogenase expression/formation protein HypD
MNKVFRKCDSEWRGFGVIKASGLKLRKEFEGFDAEKRFKIPCTIRPFGAQVQGKPKAKNRKPITENRCICGEVLKGKKEPVQCRLFGRSCTPSKPIGACMVSSEGTCAAWYKYKVKS